MTIWIFEGKIHIRAKKDSDFAQNVPIEILSLIFDNRPNTPAFFTALGKASRDKKKKKKKKSVPTWEHLWCHFVGKNPEAS